MKILKTLALVNLCLLLVSPAFAQSVDKPRKENEILYKVKTEITSEQETALQALISQYQINPPGEEIEKINVKLIEIDKGTETTEEKICQLFMDTGAVEFAEPNYLHEPAYIPNDPEYLMQPFHHQLGIEAAWDIFMQKYLPSPGDPNLIVGVCDTGVDSSHSDLSANLSPFQGRWVRRYRAGKSRRYC